MKLHRLCQSLAICALLFQPVPSPAVKMFRVPTVEVTASRRAISEGLASYYHPWFNGRLMANGERYSPASMTGAVAVRDSTVEVGDSVRVCRTDFFPRCVSVLITDTGGFGEISDPLGPRIIDLSLEAMRQLAGVYRGRIPVTVETI